MPGFAGRVGPGPDPALDDKAFVAFLDMHPGQTVRLDLTLDDEQAALLLDAAEQDNGDKRHFFAIPEAWDAPELGGTEVSILVPAGQALGLVTDRDPPRLTGLFAITDSVGPQMGYFTYVLDQVEVGR